MVARASAFVIWSLAAAVAMFWGLRLLVHSAPAPAYAVATAKSAAMHGDLGRLFGTAPSVVVAQAEAVQAPSRFRLLGVMAPKAAAGAGDAPYGLALIAVDGKPAKAFAVGAHLDSDLVLQSVGLRTASITSARDATSLVLELPALPPPATGVLGAAVPGGAPVAAGARASAQPVPAVSPSLSNGAAFQNGQAPAAPPQVLPGAITPGLPALPTADNSRSQ